MEYQKPKVYDPPIGKAHYRHFQMPEEWEPHIKQIIGKDGCNFIRVTKKSGCMYIWHHRDNGRIEVWGPMSRVMKGEQMLRDLAAKYISKDGECPKDADTSVKATEPPPTPSM